VGHQRIRLSAAELLERNSFLLEIPLNPIEQAALFHATPAKNEQRPLSVVLFQSLCRLFLRPPPRNNFRRRIKRKTVHGTSLLFFAVSIVAKKPWSRNRKSTVNKLFCAQKTQN